MAALFSTPGSIDTFVAAAANPVNLEFGPNGNLYYADFDGGTIRRIQRGAAPPPPGSQYLSDLNWTSRPTARAGRKGPATAGPRNDGPRSP